MHTQESSHFCCQAFRNVAMPRAAPARMYCVGCRWCALTGQNFSANHAPASIDFTAVHLWPDNWDVSPLDTTYRCILCGPHSSCASCGGLWSICRFWSPARHACCHVLYETSCVKQNMPGVISMPLEAYAQGQAMQDFLQQTVCCCRHRTCHAKIQIQS